MPVPKLFVEQKVDIFLKKAFGTVAIRARKHKSLEWN